MLERILFSDVDGTLVHYPDTTDNVRSCPLARAPRPRSRGKCST